MKSGTKFFKSYWMEIMYLLMLLIVIISNFSSEQSMLIVKGVLVISLWGMPYFLNTKFKVINTLILSGSIIWVTSTFFKTSRNDSSTLAVVVALMLFVALVLNVLLVIKDMYQRKETSTRKHNGFKLAYVVFAFLIIIGTVLLSYSHIYANIQFNDPSSFVVGNQATFSALYYSSTTYFTVGFGDITAVSDLARGISISQMIFGYVITCLIIPTVLVAFQKLFDNEG